MLLKGFLRPCYVTLDLGRWRRPGEFLTVREAARVLKVSTATVYKLCARGELGHMRVLNAIRIPEENLRTTKYEAPSRNSD